MIGIKYNLIENFEEVFYFHINVSRFILLHLLKILILLFSLLLKTMRADLIVSVLTFVFISIFLMPNSEPNF